MEKIIKTIKNCQFCKSNNISVNPSNQLCYGCKDKFSKDIIRYYLFLKEKKCINCGKL